MAPCSGARARWWRGGWAAIVQRNRSGPLWGRLGAVQGRGWPHHPRVARAHHDPCPGGGVLVIGARPVKGCPQCHYLLSASLRRAHCQLTGGTQHRSRQPAKRRPPAVAPLLPIKRRAPRRVPACAHAPPPPPPPLPAVHAAVAIAALLCRKKKRIVRREWVGFMTGDCRRIKQCVCVCVFVRLILQRPVAAHIRPKVDETTPGDDPGAKDEKEVGGMGRGGGGNIKRGGRQGRQAKAAAY